MIEEAILVMDSRTQTGKVRSQATGFDWTRLYKTQHCYLDLWLQRTPSGAVLVGRVIPEELSQTLVGYVDTPNHGPIPLDLEGGFRLDLSPGLHDLHIYLSNESFSVNRLTA